MPRKKKDLLKDDNKLMNESEIKYKNEDEEIYMLTAWFDKIENYDNSNLKIDELVIALFLTRKTVEKSMELIKRWLDNELNKDNINSILKK